jgi:hypothetical protein
MKKMANSTREEKNISKEDESTHSLILLANRC